MNKLGIVLGAAAVAIAAGCMDPNYVRPNTNASQNTATPVVSGDTPTLTPDVKPVADDELPGYPGEATPDIDISVAPVSSCTCAPGTVHDAPCTCGAPDCQCTVATPQPPPPPAEVMPAPAVEETTTTYVVHPGDTLFLISKRFNVKLDSIRKANPQIKNDAIRVGQTITLPAKVDLGKYAEPLPQATPVKKEFVPYTGPTTEYTVKSGDCVSRLAVKNGITSKQLMTLNNLSNANIRIGQKILLPATGAAAAAPAAVKQEKPVVKSEKPKVAPPPASIPAKPEAPVVEPVVVEEPVADDYPTVEETVPAPEPKVETPAQASAAPAADQSGDYIPYVVMKGEDITALSISFGIDPSVIREINNMGDDDQLVPGQTIRLPADAQ